MLGWGIRFAALMIVLAGCSSSDGLANGDGTTGSSGSGGTTGATGAGPGTASSPDGGADSGTAGGGGDTGTTTGSVDDTGGSDGTTGEPANPACKPFDDSTAYADPGPFVVVSGQEGPDCTIFRPDTLGELGTHPIIIWGNGTTATPPIYAGILNHWASHGFVVAAANTSNAGSGVEMLACLDYLQDQATTSGSVYEGMLDLQRVGASGHSQGGGGTIMVGTDPRIVATAPVEPYTEQGFGGYDQASQSMQVGPMFMVSGGADTIAPSNPNQQRVWDSVTSPVIWGTKAGIGHIFGVIGNMDAYRYEVTAWMRYELMCDEQASTVFVGDCSLCSDPDWTVMSTP